MSFAENLQYLRKRNRITQEELADFLQVSRQSVSKWETGEAYPETEKLIALCDKFGVTLDALLRGDLTVQSEYAECERAEEETGAYATEAQSDGEKAEEDCCKEKRKKTKSEILGDSFGGFIMLSCVIAYLIMGFTANLWHPGWIIFLGGITLCTFLGSVLSNDGGHGGDEDDGKDYNPTFKERMFGGFAAASMMAATVVFLCLGFFANLWHPGWISFIAGGALSSVFGGLAHYFSAKEE